MKLSELFLENKKIFVDYLLALLMLKNYENYNHDIIPFSYFYIFFRIYFKAVLDFSC